ncbi:hypothetical protein CC80DRAFT_228391 [Byssothecium circinans]|uniref:Transcription elongation factor Eaf N-terminal domain-containing protein n=1 Tax=Byssothecium circinans TaxID=147558 RepID=A0A6A5TNK0_9PLEO|nr:hypothetical protein CC80DRAFT_228391 [Byssothecium circinans]
MASPIVEGRVDPHKKAHYTLHISDRIADGEVGDFTGIRFNHKPAQPTSSRTTRITPKSSNVYNLSIEDEKAGDGKDVFIFTGQKTTPKKSYILLFDPATQKATLEPLASSYTFNVSSKNGTDMSSIYPKIYPRKQKDDAPDTTAAAGDELFDDDRSRDDVTTAPDPDNPFDFRHFLNKEKEGKKGDESEYGVSSPDYRTGTGSAMNTPQVAATRKPAASNLGPKAKAKAPAQTASKVKKRKSPEPDAKKTVAKKPPPTVRLERRATTDPKPKPEPAKPTKKAAVAPPSSRIKSAEIVHSSDEEDEDADGESDHEFQATKSSPPPVHRSPPSPPLRQQHHHSYDPASDEDEDEEMENVGGTRGGLDLEIEFEIPDERPSKPKNALRPNLGYLASPAGGPISLASAASSVEGTPQQDRKNNAHEDGVIDFGGMGGAASDDEDDAGDHDVDDLDIGPPAQTRHEGEEDGDMEMEEDDPFYKEMMEGLAGGDSSEESEEE